MKNNKLTKGPANAINDITAGDCIHPVVEHVIDTKAGTKKINGDLINASITPIPNQKYAA